MSVEILGSDCVPLALFREHLARGNKLRFRAGGGSMWPTIRSGDIVHVAPAEGLALGDVVLYERGQAWFVHRLIRVERSAAGQQRLILRGDALPVADPPVRRELVLGRVCMIDRGARPISLDAPLSRAYATLWRIPLLGQALLPQACRYLARVRQAVLRLGKRLPLGG